jgi:hypothetical protein
LIVFSRRTVSAEGGHLLLRTPASVKPAVAATARATFLSTKSSPLAESSEVRRIGLEALFSLHVASTHARAPLAIEAVGSIHHRTPFHHGRAAHHWFVTHHPAAAHHLTATHHRSAAHHRWATHHSAAAHHRPSAHKAMPHQWPAALLRAEAAAALAAEAVLALKAAASELASRRRSAIKAMAAHLTPIRPIKSRRRTTPPLRLAEGIKRTTERFGTATAWGHPPAIVAAGIFASLEGTFPLASESAAAGLPKSAARHAAGHRAASHRAGTHFGTALALAGPHHFLSQRGQKILKPREDRVRLIGSHLSTARAAEASAALHHSPALLTFITAVVGTATPARVFLRAPKSARPSSVRAAALATLTAHGRPTIALHWRTKSAAARASETATAKATASEATTTHAAPRPKASRAACGRPIGIPRGRLRRRGIRAAWGGRDGQQSHGTSQRKHAAQHKASTFLERHRPPG